MDETPDLLSTDRALLDAFRRGERAALARVFRHYAPAVWRTLRSGVVVHVDGHAVRLSQGLEDIELETLVQETFARVLKPEARARYDGLRPFGAWVATVARNLLIDRARAQRREPLLVGAEAIDRLVDDHGAADSPERALQDKQVRAAVDAFTATLSPRDRAIFRARYEELLSLRDAAEALQIPLITVRRVDVRLRDALRLALSSHRGPPS